MNRVITLFSVIAISFAATEARAQTRTITCSSDDGGRHTCSTGPAADVRLVRQISGSPCRQGETWDFDSRGIWVDRGCRAEFQVSAYVAAQTGANVVRCSSDDENRHVCPADTRGGVRLVKQISGSRCDQGRGWGYDAGGIWVDHGCRADFEVMPAPQVSYGTANIIQCSSDDERRHVCPADTRGGVRLSRQISGSACRQGETWGYDSTGVWVDRGCRAEFEVRSGSGFGSFGDQSQAATVSCSSDDGHRHFCNADTSRGVRLVRQISGSPCNKGKTWGYDQAGIWVDRGCRAEFETGFSGNFRHPR